MDVQSNKLDIALDVCQLGTNFQNSLKQDLKYANKFVTHLKRPRVN